MKDLLDKFNQTRYEAQEVYPQTDYSIGFLNAMDYVIKTMEDEEPPSPSDVMKKFARASQSSF